MFKFKANAKTHLVKLIEKECALPFSVIRKLLRNKDVKVNGKRVKDDLICEIGDLIEVYAPIKREEEEKTEAIFLDENVAVFNKKEGTTTEEFCEKLKKDFPSLIAVHRLDRNTKGIILFALNKVAERELLQGFKKRTFQKLYLAEVVGVPKKKQDVMTAYLYKDAKESTVYVHDQKRANDVEIKTAYRVVEDNGQTSVLEVELLTGRTHQIRAHLAHIGHPIIGDGKYGDYEANKKYGEKKQRLQAYKITLFFDKTSPLHYLNERVFEVERQFGRADNEKDERATT